MASNLIIIAGALLMLWIFTYFKKKYSYFSDRGMISPTPTMPLGNFWKVGISVHFIEKINSIYREFKGRDVLCGFYIFSKPVILVLDVELIKNILVKDFYSFHDRGLYHNENTDPLSAHLFSVNFSNHFTYNATSLGAIKKRKYFYRYLIMFWGGRRTMESASAKNDNNILKWENQRNDANNGDNLKSVDWRRRWSCRYEEVP